MTQGAAQHMAMRVDRLVRSLVGVVDVRCRWTSSGSISEIHLLKTGDVQTHQLVRNVVSGIRAAFGAEIDAARVHIHDDAAQLPALEEMPQPAAAKSELPLPHVGNDQHESHNGNHKPKGPPSSEPPAATNGTGAARRNGRAHARSLDGSSREPIAVRPTESVIALPDAPIVLDHIDVERHGAALRCRVALSVGGKSYTAVADTIDTPTAEAELAARVTLDALRAGGLSSAMLQGIGLITISDCAYVVATVRDNGNGIPRAGSVPLLDSMAWSAALAVLRAAGTDAPADMRPVAPLSPFRTGQYK